MRYRNTIRGLWRYEPGGLTPEQKSPANRLPRWSFWGENNNTATATSNCHSNGGSDEQGAIQDTRNGIAPQVFGGRGRGDRRRCDAGLPDDRQGPGLDLDAVSKGTLDGANGVLVYHYGKQNALALWGSSPAFGMDANMLLSWHKYGGGKELLNKFYASIG